MFCEIYRCVQGLIHESAIPPEPLLKLNKYNLKLLRVTLSRALPTTYFRLFLVNNIKITLTIVNGVETIFNRLIMYYNYTSRSMFKRDTACRTGFSYQ